MPILSSNLLGIDIWVVVKAMFVIGMILYLLFAFIIIRQVNHMTNTLKVGFEGPIKLLAIVHFAAAVILLILAIVYL